MGSKLTMVRLYHRGRAVVWFVHIEPSPDGRFRVSIDLINRMALGNIGQGITFSVG